MEGGGASSSAHRRASVLSIPGRARSLAPRPVDLDATGLTEPFVSDLLLKHLYRRGALELTQLVDRMALAGPVLEPAITSLRNRALVESLPPTRGLPRYALTDRGRTIALEALSKSGYVGPAPVTLQDYRRVVQAQSVRSVKVTRRDAQQAFRGLVVRQELVDALGTALNSGRAVFLYGPAGTGKTFLGGRMVHMLTDTILVPHALVMDERIVQYFNPAVHRKVDDHITPGLMLNEGTDPRFVHCRRPEVVTGGELTLEMLEMGYDVATGLYTAPQQLLANNGLYLVDDLGRQRAPTDALLNRWITPMEEARDFLTIGGQHFEVPFDVILIFATNLKPTDLSDEAFLRRLGHKVPFRHIDTAEYELIWLNMCKELGIEFNRQQLDRIFHLYRSQNRPLLPCHPRDILTGIVDRLDYEGLPREHRLSMERITEAWNSYFVSLDHGAGNHPEDGA